jgi:hypothetical protein
MEYFFQGNKIRIVLFDEAFDLIADLKYFAVGIALLWANRATGDFAVAVDYTVAGSGYPRINANKFQPASEDIFSINSSEMSKLA